MKRRVITLLLLGIAIAPQLVTPAAAAPEGQLPAGAAAPEKPLRASGVLQKLDDGEIILVLALSPAQVEQVLKLPGLETGMPATPGRLGVHRGQVFVRYMLSPGAELEEVAETLLGQRVLVELDRERRVTRLAGASR